MVKRIIDLHIHSKYSRACSKSLELPIIAETCETRGIDIVATGDFTHPVWFQEIKKFLAEDTDGLYKLKNGRSKTRFIIGTELASIKKHKNKTRRLHLNVYAPNLETAEKFNKVLDSRGFNLKSDGRPILGMTAKDILELMLGVDERMVMIPAHAWTPWFGIFGSKGGYDSLEECFEDLSPYIFSIETGLSSDPIMNWRCSMLDNITLVSNSDAHSPAKLGREANVMKFYAEDAVNYGEIMRVIRDEDKNKFQYTIEFYPEEGKYHIDGHRDCNFFCNPEETFKLKGICPKCGKPLVVGVMNRVYELSDRTEEQAIAAGKNKIPYKNLVPLVEILADTLRKGTGTKIVRVEYENMIKNLGSEFSILIEKNLEDIKDLGFGPIANAIGRVREGKIYIKPGFDGEFGTVRIFKDSEGRGIPSQSGFNFD